MFPIPFSFYFFLLLFCQMRVNKITVCFLSSICQVVFKTERERTSVFFIFCLMLFAQCLYIHVFLTFSSCIIFCCCCVHNVLQFILYVYLFCVVIFSHVTRIIHAVCAKKDFLFLKIY